MSENSMSIIDELRHQADRLKVIEEHLLQKRRKTMKKFKLHHKGLFVAIVFVGLVLLWYGVWDIISIIPIIKNPYIASGIGLFLLLVTGVYYDKTI